VGIAATGTGCDCAGCDAATGVDLLTGSRDASSFLGLAGAGAWAGCGRDGCTGPDGSDLVAGPAVVTSTGTVGAGVEIGRAENRHHTTASTNTTAAPTMTGVNVDRRLAAVHSVTVFAGAWFDACIIFDAGVIFWPVSGDESDSAGRAVIEAIA
jgi:hypothetical protein